MPHAAIRSRQSTVALLLVLAHLLLSTAFSVVTPLGEAPDEADHFAYIVYLAERRALPEGSRITQSKHPPLYHIGAATVASLATPDHRFLRANPDVELAPRLGWSPNFFIHTRAELWPWADNGAQGFHLARGWSVLLSTLTVAAIYGLTLTAFPAAGGLALTVMGIAAFLPQFAFIGGAVNNDNAAALFGTLAMWSGLLLWRNGARLSKVWWSPFVLGAGLLSKTATVGLWPAIGVAILLGAGHNYLSTSDASPATATESSPNRPFNSRGRQQALRSSWRRWLRVNLLLFGGALLIAAPWWLRNWRRYGDPLGLELIAATTDARLAPWTRSDTLWLLEGWFRSFWGKFGGAGHIPMPEPIYGALAGLSVLSVAGLLGNLWPQRRKWSLTPLMLLALATGGVALAMARYSLIALGTDQGRLLFPALGPIIILWVAGLAWWTPARWSRPAGAALVLAMAGVGIFALLGVVRPAFAPPAPPPPARVAAAHAAAPVAFADLSLIGWTLGDEVTLYWRAASAPEIDYRTQLRVVAEDGTLVWEWRRSPGAGRWSTDRWPAGAVIADAYTIKWPDWAGSGRYLVEVGVLPFEGELISGDHVQLGFIER